jgi:hypothetical protein
MAVIMMYLFSNEISKLDPDKVGTESGQWIVALISGVFMIAIMLAIRSIERNRKANEPIIEPGEISEQTDN